MERVIVRYKLKPGRVEENERLVKAVYKELTELDPDNFGYSTYKLEDGLSFVHIAQNNTDGKTPLSGLTAFKQFQEGIKDRCEELPVVNHVTEIGSFSHLS